MVAREPTMAARRSSVAAMPAGISIRFPPPSRRTLGRSNPGRMVHAITLGRRREAAEGDRSRSSAENEKKRVGGTSGGAVALLPLLVAPKNLTVVEPRRPGNAP